MKREEVMTVHVVTQQAISLGNGQGDSVVMIPFAGRATGRYFEGTVQQGGNTSYT